jgi:hypothetical protein
MIQSAAKSKTGEKPKSAIEIIQAIIKEDGLAGKKPPLVVSSFTIPC